MPWSKPDNYLPLDNLGPHLRGLSPKMNTPEMDMVLYWQWVHATFHGLERTKEEAWKDLRMTTPHAQQAIDKRIVPLEIYDVAVDRAMAPA